MVSIREEQYDTCQFILHGHGNPFCLKQIYLVYIYISVYNLLV